MNRVNTAVCGEYGVEVECVFAGALVCSGLCTGRPVPAQGYRIGRVEATTGRCDARSPALFFYGFSTVLEVVKRLRGGDYSPLRRLTPHEKIF